MRSRNPALDQLKALACLTIVCHHLAVYGPMAHALSESLAGLIDGLHTYGSMATQVFLVLGGYWAAAGLAPQGTARHSHFWQPLGQRFCRLSLPFSAALMFAVIVNETVRSLGYHHPSVSATPSWSSVPAHLLMLQSIGGWESLFAGVWYIAIDFQLYALCLLWLWLCQRWGLQRAAGPAGVLLGTALSLYVWSHNTMLQVWGLYFLGAYGMGMLAWWCNHAAAALRQRVWWGFALLALGAGTLLMEWRERVAVAWLCALGLVALQQLQRAAPWQLGSCKALCWVGERSYSIFLLHFPIMLLVSAEVQHSWPHNTTANAAGMVMTVLLSIFAGDLLHEFTERVRGSWHTLHRWYWAPLGAGWLAAGMKAF